MLKSRDRPMPEPTYMSKEQTAQYLSDLRQSSSTPRPFGSRPAPPSKVNRLQRRESDLSMVTRASTDERPRPPTSDGVPHLPSQQLHHRRTESSLSTLNQTRNNPFAGRPLARAPAITPTVTDSAGLEHSSRLKRTPSLTYMEHGQRWMEKQEARSLRQALEDMDLEEERRVHAAAQDEAAQLVWKHQNPTTTFVNPDLVAKDYRSHLRKGSYHRSISQSSSSTDGHRSASNGSNHSASADEAITSMPDVVPRKVSPPARIISVFKRRTSTGKSYDNLAQAVASDIAVAHRRVSSGSAGGRRVLSSSEKKFMHPEDRIWEDPQEQDHTTGSVALGHRPTTIQEERGAGAEQAPALPTHVRKNPFARVRMQQTRPERPVIEVPRPMPDAQPVKHHRVEIQRNPPSQSRNPWYMSNQPLPPSTPAADHNADETSPKATPTRDVKEIRSDEIRAATSKSRKDYSPRLPRPTIVSDKPGRPIVSFQKDRQLRETISDAERAPPLPRASTDPVLSRPERPGSASSVFRPATSSVESSAIPQISIDACSSARPIPTISLPDDDTSPPPPAISVSAPPAILIDNVAHEPSAQVAPGLSLQRPLPSRQPLPNGRLAGPLRSSLHTTPSFRQSGALCAHCALPIAGRILSAAGERFHPGCFVCHQCNTNLECVAFYPEPEKQREARLSFSHQSDHDVLDSSPRFYCHLDFHEMFSPRCKSCKTPIEGGVIVACGAEWHAGHFFCAQCGDPFDSATPFVEKDGYAWCVGCHTNRFSPKCRKCRKPVTDVVVKALGADWHGACFVCTECHAEFDDGRYFLRGESQDPVCVKCEERRLKA